MENKTIAFIINNNEYSDQIVKSFIEDGRYKIILLVNDLNFFKTHFFDIWDKFESIIEISEDESVTKSLQKYKIDHLISIMNLNSEESKENLGLIKLFKKLNYKNLIFVNQFLNKKQKRVNFAFNEVYLKYLSELAIVHTLNNYHIIRIGKIVSKEEFEIEKNKNFTLIEDLIQEMKTIVNNRIIYTYPYLTQYLMMLRTRPIFNNINLTYNNTIVSKDRFILQYTKFENIYDLHVYGKYFILYGLLFKLTSFLLKKTMKKF
jgi:hypothetical protein